MWTSSVELSQELIGNILAIIEFCWPIFCAKQTIAEIKWFVEQCKSVY